jgi:hypothetical protein
LKNRFEAARAEFELAFLYRDEDKQLDAHALLVRCFESFSSFGVERYLRQVEEALAEYSPT